MLTTTATERPCHLSRHLNHRRRTLAMLIAAATAMFAGAASAHAQTVPTISKSHDCNNAFATTRESNCTHELVAIDGQETTHFDSQDTPGMFRSKFSDHQWGKGTSATAQYQFQEWSDNTFESTTNTFTTTMVFRHHLIRLGPSVPNDDEFETIVVEFKFVNGVPVSTPKDVNMEACK